MLFLNSNYNLNLTYIIALTLSIMPAGLYFSLVYFSFTFTMHLAKKLSCNNTMYLVPSMAF
jgi:hypothetical protein